MDILRSVNGVYQCVSNPENTKRYVLREIKSCYPVLVPVEDADGEEKVKVIARRYPIRVLTEEDFYEKAQVQQNGLFFRLKKALHRWRC